MTQLLSIKNKQVIAKQAIQSQQTLTAQADTAFVIDQPAAQTLPKVQVNADKTVVTLNSQESLVLDTAESAELFLHTPEQNYKLVYGQWMPVDNLPLDIVSPIPVSESVTLHTSAENVATLSGLADSSWLWGGLGIAALGSVGFALSKGGSSGSGSNSNTPESANQHSETAPNHSHTDTGTTPNSSTDLTNETNSTVFPDMTTGGQAGPADIPPSNNPPPVSPPNNGNGSNDNPPTKDSGTRVFHNINELMNADLASGVKASIMDFNHVNDNLNINYVITDTLPAEGIANRIAVPLANGNYALPQINDFDLPVQNSQANIEAMLAVARTYVDAGNKLVWDANGESPLNTTGRPATSKTPDGKDAFAITCSTFINMVLSGWKYEDTTYASDENVSSYGWGIDLANDRPQGDSGPYGANRQLKWFAWKDQVALYNGKSNGQENYQIGDILFFSKQDPEGVGTGGKYFMNVYHSAIYIGNNQIMHSAGTYHGNGVVIETLGQALKSDLSYIARPHLGNSSVSIEGKPEIGQSLKAVVADGDGVPADVSYQWYSNNKPITGATSQSYTLTVSDVGHAISVRASFADGSQYVEKPTSAVILPTLTTLTTSNSAPADIILSATNVMENRDGVVIGRLTSIDANANDTHRYTVNDNRFEVVGNQLKLKAGKVLDFANEPRVSITITSTDSGNLSTQKTFVLNVQDDPNYPVTTPGKLGVYVPAPTTAFIANVKDGIYGAKGDGRTNDTAAIQKAVDAVAAQGGGVVDIPAGTYMIDGLQNVRLKNNVIIRMTEDTTLKALPNDQTSYAIFRLQNVENVHIIGGTLEGERFEHGGTTGQGGFGVLNFSSRNVVIENVTAKNFWGDGFLVGRYYLNEPAPDNLIFYNVTADGNRRQGMSITDGSNIKVINSTFKNTHGQSPQSGIDIEPNPSEHSPLKQPDGTKVAGSVSNVEIINSVFDNNAAYGVVVSANSDAQVHNVQLMHNQMNGNLHAILFNGVEGGKIISNTTHDNGKAIPYFDVDLMRSNNIEVRDNVMYGGRERNYDDGALQGIGHTFDNNVRKSAVYIKGEMKVGAELSAKVEDGDGVPFSKYINYDWMVDGKSVDFAGGGDKSTYVVRAEDAGKRISVSVSFNDGKGHAETAVSLSTDHVIGSNGQGNRAAPLNVSLLNHEEATTQAVASKALLVENNAKLFETPALNLKDAGLEQPAQYNATTLHKDEGLGNVNNTIL